MGLEQSNVIDALGEDRETGEPVLNIIDSWEWFDEREHLLALQDKLNGYFAFVESGQLAEHFGCSQNSAARLHVVFRYAPPPSALRLLNSARVTAEPLNIRVDYEVQSGSDS